MACFRARVFSRRCSNADGSASTSVSTSAMAVCSWKGGNLSLWFFTTFQSERGIWLPYELLLASMQVVSPERSGMEIQIRLLHSSEQAPRF